MSTPSTALPWDALRMAAGRAPAAPRAAAPVIAWSEEAGWHSMLPANHPQRPWLDLYLPVVNGRPGKPGAGDRPFVVAHLGQSLDGFIATCSGDSNYVTGEENLCHLHRMRALCDAVIVGRGTAERDDPQLTTRRVEGPNPLRVVLDSGRRLPSSLRIFNDGAAPTLRVVSAELPAPPEGAPPEIAVPTEEGRIALRPMLAALAARGCRRVFVEGGGELVSALMSAGLLDRLHLAIAPLLIGSGRPAIRLAARPELGDCPRPPARLFRMGGDLLYDLDLAGTRPAPAARPPDHPPLTRVY